MEVNVYFNGPATEIDMGPREFSVIPATGPAGADGQPGRDGTIENLNVEAETLPAGSQATASYENNLLTLGIPQGAKGNPGDDGQDGVGVPPGGTTGQVLKKKSGTDYDTEWANESGGGGGGTWGSITGTLSNQTDLQTALDEKAKKAINVNISSSAEFSVGTWSYDVVTYAGEPSGGSCYYRLINTSLFSGVTIYHKFSCSVLKGFSGVVYITTQANGILIETSKQPESSYRIVGTIIEGKDGTAPSPTKITPSVSGLTNDAGYVTAKTYSTSEVATGDTWVDGKPIYRYVINNAAATATGDVVLGTLPSVPDNVISINGALLTSNGYRRTLNYAPEFGIQYGVYVDVSTQDCKVHAHIGSGVGTPMYFTIVLEYTKATT